ncbi:ABC transporter permease [Conexibacter arvalis]|uniref:Putative ABC transport system permease protein n=1 Tax=Conexibacter arvalis TaxID=912552 RepID=A0A840I9J7_9ACTN|nr:FtsX-like permease family protein [Conexibacter arvalis]MBB4660804.1 putative ABC transport system permease protein [Conexibacter arvalis]
MRSPTILGVRPTVLLGLYRWRVRAHPGKELLAAAGVAVGVALIFGVLVANTSMTRSAGDLVRSIVGSAQLQLAARSTDGMPAGVADQVAAVPGVRNAVPVLRVQATLVGPGGRRPVQVMGVTPALAELDGTRTQGWGRGGLPLAQGLTLPATVGRAVGAEPGEHVRLLIGGEERAVVVGTLLGSDTIGTLDGMPIAVAPLALLQVLAGMSDRISQVLVQTDPDRLAEARRGLERVAGDRLDVTAADHELRLLETTARPNDLSTGLFAAISAMVGFLLAFNAILLTVPERRRWIAELRMQGWAARQIVLTLLFDALVLGLLASGLGVLLGIVLSRTLFDAVPAYLAFAFPLGTQQMLTAGAVLVAIAGGVLATVIASLLPTLDLRSPRPDLVLAQPGEAGEALRPAVTKTLALAGLATIALATLLAMLAPPLTVASGVLLAAATLLLIPAAFDISTRLLARALAGVRRSVLPLAVVELRAAATRSIAVACVAALAVYGCVAIQGARSDLIRGLDRNFGDYLETADLWVTTGGDDLTTNSFRLPAGALATIERLPQVRSVRRYQGGLLDVEDRRLWVIARPAEDRAMVPASQLLAGDLTAATDQLRAGGAVAISQAIADDRQLALGDTLELPTPAGIAHLRVAAVTTNLGWPPGAVILNATDYRHWWRSHAPTALQIDLQPRADRALAARAVHAALGDTPALRVQTAAERTAQYASLSRQGLRSLQQIATLLLIAAGLAVALALAAALSQRRPRLAWLKVDGFSSGQLWRSVLAESTLVLLLGGVAGGLTGLYGHLLASRWLQIATGFPAPFSLGGLEVAATVGLLAAIALTTIAIPGWLAARVPPRATFQG